MLKVLLSYQLPHQKKRKLHSCAAKDARDVINCVRRLGGQTRLILAFKDEPLKVEELVTECDHLIDLECDHLNQRIH